MAKKARRRRSPSVVVQLRRIVALVDHLLATFDAPPSVAAVREASRRVH